MKPISPVIPGRNFPEVVFAKHQPEYLPLPAISNPEGRVTTRWCLSWRERLQALWGGNVWLQVLTFNHPLQPVKLMTEPPEVA